MAYFTDSQGTNWTPSISIDTARRLKALAQPIDLLDPKSLSVAIDDLYLRFDILWECCRRQAEAIGIDVNEFDQRLATAEAFIAANTAMQEALCDFFLRAGRKDLARLIRLASEAAEGLEKLRVDAANSPKTKAAMDQALAAVEREMEQEIDRALANLEATFNQRPEPEPLPTPRV